MDSPERREGAYPRARWDSLLVPKQANPGLGAVDIRQSINRRLRQLEVHLGAMPDDRPERRPYNPFGDVRRGFVGMGNDIQDVLEFFKYDHLPAGLAEFSRPFCELAHKTAATLAHDNRELLKCLDRLLEAKDCAVRAAMSKGFAV